MKAKAGLGNERPLSHGGNKQESLYKSKGKPIFHIVHQAYFLLFLVIDNNNNAINGMIVQLPPNQQLRRQTHVYLDIFWGFMILILSLRYLCIFTPEPF